MGRDERDGTSFVAESSTTREMNSVWKMGVNSQASTSNGLPVSLAGASGACECDGDGVGEPEPAG